MVRAWRQRDAGPYGRGMHCMAAGEDALLPWLIGPPIAYPAGAGGIGWIRWTAMQYALAGRDYDWKNALADLKCLNRRLRLGFTAAYEEVYSESNPGLQRRGPAPHKDVHRDEARGRVSESWWNRYRRLESDV